MKLSLAAAGVVSVVIALLVGLFAVNGGQEHGGRRPLLHIARNGSAVLPQPEPLRLTGPTGARQLASDLDRAQEVIDARASPSGDLARAGLLEQLATVTLAREAPGARHSTLALLRPHAAATMRANLAASAALSRLTAPQKQFPPWRIVYAPGPWRLLSYFRAAQSRFGVGWEYLAAIEFIETRFGRIRGPSAAGAQGPMQMLPATWGRYGNGNIDNQRDAIFAGARYLVAGGAPADMAAALYHYNNSPDYVAAVQDYAGRMRADPRAYLGYYNWQVDYARVDGVFILPAGYPRVRPDRVQYP